MGVADTPRTKWIDCHGGWVSGGKAHCYDRQMGESGAAILSEKSSAANSTGIFLLR